MDRILELLTPVSVKAARGMVKGLALTGVLVAWMLASGPGGDHEFILLTAIGSGMAFGAAFYAVKQGHTHAPSTLQMLAVTALAVPYVLGVYFLLYRGLWGATTMLSAPSFGVVLRSFGSMAIGYTLLELAGDMGEYVRSRYRATQ